MIDVDRYLDRIGFTATVSHDLATLEALQRSHLSAVPFENLHVFYGIGVRTDVEWSVSKIVDEGRGGWCFENNGAFSELLLALGFDIGRLGAAVLLEGPTRTIDHLCIEVALEERHPHLSFYWSTNYDALRDDPRYRQFLSRLNLGSAATGDS